MHFIFIFNNYILNNQSVPKHVPFLHFFEISCHSHSSLPCQNFCIYTLRFHILIVIITLLCPHFLCLALNGGSEEKDQVCLLLKMVVRKHIEDLF